NEAHRIEAIQPLKALESFEEALATRPKLILDGVFGIGLNRALDADWIRLFTRINESGIPLLAIDTPSGLHSQTGEPMGAALRATVTLMLGAPKDGLLKASARPFVGRLELASNLGLIDCPFESPTRWTSALDFRTFPPPREPESHKGTYGRLAIVAGSIGYHGAAVLACRGAQRAQPGLITLHSSSSAFPLAASQLQAVMARPIQAAPEIDPDSSCVLVGPGLAGSDVPTSLPDWLARVWREESKVVVVDASALDWIPEGPAPGERRVMTPHPGEAARLLGVSVQAVQSDRPAALRALSKKFGNCWVVLKGNLTLVGRSDGEIHVNPSGNPHLAQAGAGDLLAGWLSGLLAQPRLAGDPGQTIRYAVWKHGAVADDLQRHRPHWIIEDLAAWTEFPQEKPKLSFLPQE
ncbi:MAG: NAD(P)H-hydrate dehydratase, partial [Verrucomicrobia bacterium]|nr:NAD(P)H-hydrate dehydratase [Verrucomicrobiota bacterium]